MQKRVHSREFKLDIVRQVTTGQKRPAQACREYGVELEQFCGQLALENQILKKTLQRLESRSVTR